MTKKNLLIGIGIFLTALSLRLWQVNLEAINPDEYHWHERTNLFYHVIQDGRLEDTMLAGHPGATITWQSMISLRAMRLIYRQFDPTFDYQDFPYLPHTFDRVHFAYVLPIILVTSLLVAFIYLSLTTLTNRTFALIASLLVLVDVYFLGQSRVVQMDALQTSFIIGSLFTALLYQQTKRKIFFVTTAILFALNIMTKIYGLCLLPILWIILCWSDLITLISQKSLNSLKQMMVKTLFLILTLGIVCVLLLPAWLFDFNDTIDLFRKSIFDEGLKATWEGNEFFFGRLFDRGEPKIFYLFALGFRQSVLAFLGTLVTLWLLIRNKIQDQKIRKILIVTFSIALYWLVVLSLPGKKEDRYILETIVLLDVFAAGGIYWLYLKLKDRLGAFSNIILNSLLLILVLIVPFFISTHGLNHEYIGYYNPLLGGNKSAVRFIRVGWGEGLRAVTYYLNTQKDAENIRVASWYEMSTAPRCLCEVKPTFEWENDKVRYLVFYVNQLQRQKEPTMTNTYLEEDNVVFESKINGLTYAWVVKKPK